MTAWTKVEQKAVMTAALWELLRAGKWVEWKASMKAEQLVALTVERTVASLADLSTP
jgi:hypothetical protein